MLVARVTALRQDRNAARSGVCIRCLPDREFPIVAWRPGEGDPRWRLGSQRIINNRLLRHLDALGHDIEVFVPCPMERRTFFYDYPCGERLPRCELLSVGHQVRDLISAECTIEIR